MDLSDVDEKEIKRYREEIEENNEKIQKAIKCMRNNCDNIEIVKVCHSYITDSLNILKRCEESIKGIYDWQTYRNNRKIIESTLLKKMIKDEYIYDREKK